MALEQQVLSPLMPAEPPASTTQNCTKQLLKNNILWCVIKVWLG